MRKIILFLVTVVGISFLFSLHPQPTQAAYGAQDYMTAGWGIQLLGCPSDPKGVFGPSCQEYNPDKLSLPTWMNGTKEDHSLGAFQQTMHSLTAFYRTPPANTQTYIADLLHNSRLAPAAYAQGLGYASLSPVLSIWKAFRNVAYFLFVIVFVVIGFAIMFRAKLNPQTVVNIENSLPKLIITLILITFSYAIAGFMIDLMYLVIRLTIGLFQGGLINSDEHLQKVAFNNSIFSNFFELWIGESAIATDVADGMTGIINNIVKLGPLESILGTVLSGVMYLVLGVVLLVQSFRVFFALLTSYIQIILLIIFSPIQLLLNAMPGSNALTNWLRNLAGNLAVFPAVIIMILMANVFSGKFTDISFADGGFTPPQLASTFTDISGLFVLGFILLIPDVINKTKTMFGVAGGGGGGAGAGGFMGGFGGAAFGSALGPAFGAVTRYTGVGTAARMAGSFGGQLIGARVGDFARNIPAVQRYQGWQAFRGARARIDEASTRGSLHKAQEEFKKQGGTGTMSYGDFRRIREELNKTPRNQQPSEATKGAKPQAPSDSGRTGRNVDGDESQIPES